MPTTYKVLGQINPSATTSATLYTVPNTSTSTVVSTITVCNLASTAATYRIAVQQSGATLANKHYVVYGATVAGSDTTT